MKIKKYKTYFHSNFYLYKEFVDVSRNDEKIIKFLSDFLINKGIDLNNNFPIFLKMFNLSLERNILNEENCSNLIKLISKNINKIDTLFLKYFVSVIINYFANKNPSFFLYKIIKEKNDTMVWQEILSILFNGDFDFYKPGIIKLFKIVKQNSKVEYLWFNEDDSNVEKFDNSKK